MTRSIFVNLPVQDLAATTAFYEALGFIKNPQMCNDDASALTWSDTISIMLLRHEVFSQFSPKEIGDVRTTTTALISLSVEGRAIVDALAETAIKHGGQADVGGVHDDGFMYGRDFEDPDGNGFGIFWVDPNPPEKS